MLSNFEIAAIALLLVNIGLSIYCLSKKASEEKYITYVATRPTKKASEEKYITYVATRPTTMPPTNKRT